MRDEDKSKAQLVAELASLRRQLANRPDSPAGEKGETTPDLSELRYRQLFESMTSGVAVYEAVDGGQDFIFKDFNRAGEQIEGVNRAEIIGRRVTEVFPGVVEFGLMKQLQQVWQTGQRISRPAALYRDERISGWRENHIYKLPSGEVVAVYNDVTERKQFEAELARTSDINAAIASLSGFLISLESLDEVSTLVLGQARRLTGSQFGYVGYIEPQSGFLICPTMIPEAHQGRQAREKGTVLEEFSGLWGWVLEQRKPLLTNNAADDPRSTGLPFDHMPVHRFLSAPALVGEKIVGQIALANADRDYTDEDLSLVQRLATLYALAVQRIQAEEALQESEDRFRQLAENISKVFWIGSPDWNEVMYVSPAYEAIWGCSCQSLYDAPHSWLDAILSEDRDRVLADVKRKAGGDLAETQFPEYRIARPDGEVRWISARAFPVEDDQGRVYRIAGIAEDITARKQVEAALRESEQKYRSLYASMMEGVALHEIVYGETGQALDYVILDVNPAYESITGLSRENVIGGKASEVYGTVEPPYLGIFSEVVVLNKPTSFETYFEPMGKHFNISVFSPGRNKFATVFEDITERIQFEESRRREHDLLNRVMETSPVGISVVDRTGEISFANSRAAEILGVTEKEIGGLLYDDPGWRITDYDGNPWPDEALPFRRVMATGQPVYDVRHAIEGPTGRRILLSINAAPLFDQVGRVDSVISVIEDVTARVQEEQQRRKQLEQELGSLNLLSSPPNSGVTAQMFGLTPLRQNLPDIFQKLVEQYGELLDRAVEQRLYKIEHQVSDGLRKIAGHLGALQAGPRDVVECHSLAVKQKVGNVDSGRTKVYLEESRLAVLELMGYLTTYYRNYAMGSGTGEPTPHKKTGAGHDE
jgi:PAS domain S-box-containing protein